MTQASISKRFSFSASHQLTTLPDEHPCSRLHGHNYEVEVRLWGTVDPRGFVFDYRDLAPFKDWIDEALDHRHLNEAMGPEPTAENLATWFCRRLLACVALPPGLMVKVGVSETPKTWAFSEWTAGPR